MSLHYKIESFKFYEIICNNFIFKIDIFKMALISASKVFWLARTQSAAYRLMGRALSTTQNNDTTDTLPRQEAASHETFDENVLKARILENTLKFVPQYGFTVEAINEGITDAGLSSAATNGIFQNGAFDLINYFYKKCNADLADYLERLVKEGEITKKNELIRLALIYRLRLTQPYIKHWPQVCH